MAQGDISFEGSDLKIQVEMTASGFDMDTDDWSVGIKCGSKIVAIIPKADAIRNDSGWFVCIRAEKLKTGLIEVIGYGKIQDNDFDDGIRNEVNKDTLLNYKKL